MKKKFYMVLTVFAIGFLSVSSLGANVSLAKSSADFSDLQGLDAATKAKFDALLSAGIFDGVSEDTFGLKEEMNRAQFAKIAATLFDLRTDSSSSNSSFSDVNAGDPANGYALPYIEAIKRAGITDGVGDGKFDPAGQVTKEQMAAFLVKGLNTQQDVQMPVPIADETISDWAKGYVGAAVKLGLLENSSDGTFDGKQKATRDLLGTASFQAAKITELTKPLEVSKAEFLAGNELHLMITVGIDANSIDLSKITINGVPLNPTLDRYELAADNKTIIIKLHEGFQLDLTAPPVIKVTGLISLFGNDVQKEESRIIPVELTVAPVNSTIPNVPEQAPVLEPFNPEPEPESPQPIPSPVPNPEPEAPVEGPVEEPEPGESGPEPAPNPEPEAPVEEPVEEPGPDESEPEPVSDPNPEEPVEEPGPGEIVPEPIPGGIRG